MKKEKKTRRKKLQKAIGARLSIIREQLGKTAFEIGDPSLTHSGSISRVESGETKPSLELLHSLCADYCINLNWLFTGKGGEIQG